MPKCARGQLKLPSGEVWTTTAPTEARLRASAKAWRAEVVGVEVKVRRTNPFAQVRVTKPWPSDEPTSDPVSAVAGEMVVESFGMGEAPAGGGLIYVGGKR